MKSKKLKIKGIEIDVRSKHSLYVTIGDWVYYIDDSTNEQIIDKWHKVEQTTGIKLTPPADVTPQTLFGRSYNDDIR